LTSDGRLLFGANNAEDPPFGTLFQANGDSATDHSKKLIRVTVDASIMPPGFGLSIEQPAWDPKTRRFLTSIPVIKDNPPGCNYGQLPTPASPGPITCDGGLLVTDPAELLEAVEGGFTAVTQGAFNAHNNSGVVMLHHCGPNGASVGPDDNVLLGCTPQNNPSDVISLAINAKTKAQTPIANITGSDEVWFNAGDDRYYTGSSRNCKTFPITAPCPLASQQQAVLGVIDAEANTLIETVPQGSGSHSVAADSKRNLIFVPQVAPASVVGSGGDTTTVGAGICGTTNGCEDHDHEHDHGHDD
jgi:hypothetical protein